MATRNSITNDEIKSKRNSDKYRSNFDLIFGESMKKKTKQKKGTLKIKT